MSNKKIKKTNQQVTHEDKLQETRNMSNGQRITNCEDTSNLKGTKRKMKSNPSSGCDGNKKLRSKSGASEINESSVVGETEDFVREQLDAESVQSQEHFDISSMQPVSPTETTTTKDWLQTSVMQMGHAIISLLKPSESPLASAVDEIICSNRDDPVTYEDIENKLKRMQRNGKGENPFSEASQCEDIEADAPHEIPCTSTALHFLNTEAVKNYPASHQSRRNGHILPNLNSVELKNEDMIDACKDSVRDVKVTSPKEERVPYFMPADQTDGRAQTQAIVQDMTNYLKRLAEVQKTLPITPTCWGSPIKTGHHHEGTIDAKKNTVTKY